MTYIANPDTRKVHTCDCQYGHKSFDIEPFSELFDALANGYVEAGCCLGDRPINQAERARVMLKSVQPRRSAICSACNRQGRVEMAHIVPRHMGGARMMPLCPNCHQAFDFGEMGKAELATLALYCRVTFNMRRSTVEKFHGVGRRAA